MRSENVAVILSYENIHLLFLSNQYVGLFRTYEMHSICVAYNRAFRHASAAATWISTSSRYHW